jgi:hypothetical protein
MGSSCGQKALREFLLHDGDLAGVLLQVLRSEGPALAQWDFQGAEVVLAGSARE